MDWEFEYSATEQGPWLPIGGRIIASSFHDAFAEFRFTPESFRAATIGRVRSTEVRGVGPR